MTEDPTIRLDGDDRPHEHFIEVEVIGQIDRYKLLKPLGKGAFGEVYLAYDDIAEIKVALKILPREMASNSEELEKIRRNFSLVSRLSHPNLANVRHLHEAALIDEDAQDFMGIRPGDFLIIMDYAPGLTLSNYRREIPDGRLMVDEAIAICTEVARALDYAHQEGIIHRDIKPSNIMIGAVGRLKLLDFGLAADLQQARHSRYSNELTKICGTRQYMAPEQWMGTEQGQWTDQYQLAILFYELVYGKVPFAEKFDELEFEELRDFLFEHEIPDLRGLSPYQNAVLKKACSKNPKDRFKSCGHFINALASKNAQKQSHQPSVAGSMLMGICLALTLLTAGIYLLRPDWLFSEPEKKPTQAFVDSIEK